MKRFGRLINSYFTPIAYRKHIKCSNLQKLPFKKKKVFIEFDSSDRSQKSWDGGGERLEK